MSHIDVVLLFRGERIRVSPIANLVHIEVFFFIFFVYEMGRTDHARRFHRGETLQILCFVQALQTFRWKRVRIFLEVHNGAFRFSEKGKGALSDVFRSSGTIPKIPVAL